MTPIVTTSEEASSGFDWKPTMYACIMMMMMLSVILYLLGFFDQYQDPEDEAKNLVIADQTIFRLTNAVPGSLDKRETSTNIVKDGVCTKQTTTYMRNKGGLYTYEEKEITFAPVDLRKLSGPCVPAR